MLVLAPFPSSTSFALQDYNNYLCILGSTLSSKLSLFHNKDELLDISLGRASLSHACTCFGEGRLLKKARETSCDSLSASYTFISSFRICSISHPIPSRAEGFPVRPPFKREGGHLTQLSLLWERV